LQVADDVVEALQVQIEVAGHHLVEGSDFGGVEP
jgi:hypothetical protein